MCSLIANQVKANMCLVSLKNFIVRNTFMLLFTLKGYNNNYNCNCLFYANIRYSLYLQPQLHKQYVIRLHELQLTD